MLKYSTWTFWMLLVSRQVKGGVSFAWSAVHSAENEATEPGAL